MNTEKKITLTAWVAGALVLIPTACSNSQEEWNDEVTAAYDTSVCTDAQGNRVDDDYCDDDRYRGGGFYPYYLRRGSPVPYYGDNVRGPRYAAYGSTSPVAGTYYTRAPASTAMTRSAAVSRGGLGSTGRGFGGARG